RPTAKNPRQQLPIATGPTVKPPRRDVIAGGKFLDDLYVRGKTGAGENPLEGVDVIDAFACIGAFPEQILVHIGNCRGIWIDTADAREDTLEQGTFAADGERGRNPRLQNRIALDDPVGGGVETRPVERVSHLADQAADCIARELGVGVQRDHIPDLLRNAWWTPAQAEEI